MATAPLKPLGPLQDALPALTVFRRNVRIRTHGDARHGLARVALEDDFHHFRVEVQVREGQVRSAQGTAVRNPYSLCPSAGQQLRTLNGQPLSAVANSVTRMTDATQQCTHQLDMAGLAIAHLVRGVAQRDYTAIVPRRTEARTQPTLLRDGELLLQWDLLDDVLQGPAPYTGVHLREGFAKWALQHLDVDTAEAALVLRRCAMISMGRTVDLDALTSAKPWGRCYVEQPERAPTALRVVGSTWDFSTRPQALLADDATWLAGVQA